MALYIEPRKAGGHMFIHGDLGPHCADCGRVGEFLCDYPVGDSHTCDRSVCDDHGTEVAPEIHYCASHYQMWQDFRRANGDQRVLENVVPYKGRK